MATDAAAFLAIDQGGHSTRVVVSDEAGRTLASEAVAVATRVDGARAEQDAESLVGALSGAIQRLADRLGPRSSSVGAAGLAAQRASVVCWDRDSGRALSPVLSWLDRRGAAAVDACGLDAEAVRERTGLHLSPHYGASKLAWCLRELPAVQAAAAAGRLGLAPLSSYLAWRLGGGECYRVDATTAQRTLLWDRHTGTWSPELCRAFDIPLEHLPAVVDCDAGFGTVALGSARVPLLVCAGDQGLVPSAYGDPDPHTISINAGTGAFVLMPLASSAQAVDPGLLRTLAWSGATTVRWTQEGTVNGAAAALDRLADGALPVAGDARTAETMFLNGVGGLGAPWWIPDYPSRFTGPAADGPARERAVVDSIVFLLMANVARFGGEPARVVLSGGLSQRADLRQALADALGLPVDVPRDPEATLRGLFAALSDALAARDAELIRFAPDPGARSRWRARYQHWRSALLDRG